MHEPEHAEARAAGLRDIGEAARASGVSVKMIRHYESLGLLGEVARTSANYRIYGASQVHTLRFIARARKLGFSMPEIGELLALWQDRARPSAAVKEIAARHVEQLRVRIEELEGLAQTLTHLTSCCAGDD
ncbi:MAG: MerR family DNA-binding protein, partial [Candidatus Dactylopiibacterium sp.]|nr:MerR family DNA-binding protein [Candidatus Dactylopiibacterium sp.]